MKSGVVLACVAALVLVYASPVLNSKHGVRSSAKEHKFNQAFSSDEHMHKFAKANSKARPDGGHGGHDGPGGGPIGKAGKHLHQRQNAVVSACPDHDSPQLLEAPVTITSHGYDNNQNCAWQVNVPAGKFISVAFPHFSVEYHSTCDYDSVSIYDAENENGPLRAVLCGDDMPLSFVSLTNQVFITFSTDFSVTADGFEMVLTQSDTPGELPDSMLSCPGPLQLSGNDLTIMSPGFMVAQTYTNNLNCRWTATVSEGMFARLEFLSMHVEASAGCRWDEVIIRDGLTDDATVLGTVCGSDLPAVIVGSSDSLSVHFLTDYSVTRGGFHIRVTEVSTTAENLPAPIHPGCPVTADVSAEGGIITSANFGDDFYSNDEACQWRITAPEGQYVRLEFMAFNVESQSSCSYDRLTIYDGADDTATSATYCGANIPQPFTSVGDHVFLTFTTDGTVTAAGFRIALSAVAVAGAILPDNPILSSPGPHHIVLSQGGEPTSIYSPHFSTTGYTNSLFCSWLIEAPQGMYLGVHFMTLDLEAAPGCVFDYVNVFDGPDTIHLLLMKVCGNIPPADFVTQTNSALIEFTSDESVTATGFHMEFTLATEAGTLPEDFAPPLPPCSGPNPTIIFGGHGVIISPGFGFGNGSYGNNEYYTWLLTSAEEVTFLLTFMEFSLEEHDTCLNDYVRIHDGPYISSPVIDDYLCGDTLPESRQSTGNQMLVVFSTDCDVTDLGFALVYQTIDADGVPQQKRRTTTLPPPPTPRANGTPPTPHANNDDWPVNGALAREGDLKADILEEIEKILERRILEQ